MKFILLNLCFLLSNTAIGETINFQNKNFPGGIALFSLSSPQKPTVFLEDNRALVMPAGENLWTIVLGIPLGTAPGTHQVMLLIENQKQNLKYEVLPKVYPEQHITLKDKNQVNPDERSLNRIKAESKKISAIFKHYRENPKIDFAFIKPVDGKISGPFGLKRFFNGEARNPHSGLDFRATKGTPIQAPAAGKVLNTDEYFFNGKSVFIDHGNGLITLYCHLDKILVKAGETLNKGQVFATVGQTGRATGPHLHWSVSLNNARVDPSLFLQ